MEATFEKSVNILLQAYLNDTLQHSNCHACAVGNLIADSIKVDIALDDGNGRFSWKESWPIWQKVFMTSCDVGEQSIDEGGYEGRAKKQIDSTGYTWQQLAKVEFAFESAPKGDSEDDWMFNGLMAVVDVLAEIHEVDLKAKEEAKALFS